jgi:hypothetical protein
LSGLSTKEAGFQACKKLSLGDISCWGSEFCWRELNYSYSSLIIFVQPIVEALEGKWGSQRTVEKRRDTLLGVGQECGECKVVGC